MKKITIILSALCLFLLPGCLNSGFKKTKSGLMYKIISDGKSPQVKKGNILKIHFTQKIGDSVHVSSYEQMPFYAVADSVGPEYDPKEIFPLLHKGDSAIIIISGDTLHKRGQLPQNINREDKIILTVKVIDVFSDDNLAQTDRQTEMNKAQQKQAAEMQKREAESEGLKAPKVKEIEDYLAKNKITAQKAPQGTFVEIKDAGNGPQAAVGKRVLVRYTGKLFPSGKEFESNMGPDQQAYPVVLGTHGVIEGWEEGLLFFKKGGKGTLYVPFFLAYGSRPGPGNTPFENLIFDIVVEDVQDNAAPPPPAGQ